MPDSCKEECNEIKDISRTWLWSLQVTVTEVTLGSDLTSEVHGPEKAFQGRLENVTDTNTWDSSMSTDTEEAWHRRPTPCRTKVGPVMA